MRSVAPMKIAKIGYIIISIALCALGITLISVPDLSISVLGTICGILLMAFGVVKIIGYFSKDLFRLAFQYDLAFGILCAALGIIILIKPKSLMLFICISMGISILTDGLFKIQISLEAKKFGIKAWWLILIFAIITGVFGFILLFRPGEGSQFLMIMIGITLLFEGILNFCTVIFAVKIIKYQQPDVIEADYREC